MWIVLISVFGLAAGIILFEYRSRKPDQLVLKEKSGRIIQRRALYYPRHFSLAMPNSIQALAPVFTAEAKGKLPVRIKLAAAVAPSTESITALIRVGGWSADAVSVAGKELVNLLQSKVKEFCEKYEIEELSSARLTGFLQSSIGKVLPELGLEIVSLIVQSIDPEDQKIIEALQQREAARITEQTETASQQARIAAVKSRITADQEIIRLEHRLELGKYQLKMERQDKEADLSRHQTTEEIKRREMQLAFDRKEIEIVRDNPELLLLSPQIARLAEASQNLKNARTVVSLAPGEIGQEFPLAGLLQNFLRGVLYKTPAPAGSTEKQDAASGKA
jgi:hypothetical protein